VTNLLQFTLNVLKFHRQPQCTLQLVGEDHLLFVWIKLHVTLCRQQDPNCELQFASCSQYLLPFSFFTETHKEKFNGFRSVDTNNCISVTIQNETLIHVNLFLQWPIMSPPKVPTLPPASLNIYIKGKVLPLVVYRPPNV